MLEPIDLVVRGGTVVGAGPTRPLDIAIRAGRIEALADPGTLAVDSTGVLDASGMHVLAGVIDGHVHFREPGFEHKEDWLTGTRAAVFGGVTTVIDMPNTQPPTRTANDARAKAALAAGKAVCDFGLHGLVDSYFDPRQLGELVGSGLIVGLKVFLGPTTGGLAAPDEGSLLNALGIARLAGLRVGFHAEDPEMLARVASMLGEPTDARGHLDGRPPQAEAAAIDRVGRLLEQSGAGGHIFHLSSIEGLDAVARWRERGLDLTSEVTAHHCFLGLPDYDRLGGGIRVNPPVRGEPHATALLAALADGRIDTIGSDHAPHMAGEKSRDYPADALAGLNGVETSLPLLLTAVSEGRLSVERLAEATSAAPARVWGLRDKGRLEVGADADLTIIDLAQPGVIRGAELHGKQQHTPFEGMATTGAPVATIVRGNIVMRDGQSVGQPGSGRIVSRG